MATIRPANAGDTSRLVDMCERFVAETAYSKWVEFSRELLVRHVALIVSGELNTRVWVAERQGELVGMLAAILTTLPGSPATVCEELIWWVEPEYRAGSIGPRLLDVLESEAVNTSTTLLKMVAPHGSQVGRYLERRGYIPVETAYARHTTSQNGSIRRHEHSSRQLPHGEGEGGIR